MKKHNYWSIIIKNGIRLLKAKSNKTIKSPIIAKDVLKCVSNKLINRLY